jgi:hypothetical protein
MEDFNALAAALGAGIADVRGCLILSSDGLVLGAHPETAEVDARPARIKLAAIGEPMRGFLQFGTEVWCYVRRGPYAALAVTGTAVRPGPVMDQMEQVLLAAEEARSRREGLRLDGGPAPAPAPTTRPRTPLHPEPRPVEEPVVIRSELAAAERAAASEAVAAEAAAAERAAAERAAAAELAAALAAGPALDAPETAPDPAPRAPGPARSDRLSARPGTAWEGAAEPEEVDRFSLAREFSRLLQDDQAPADG